ncbi:MAG: ribosomal protein L7/L12 [Phycisphaerales bacterium]|nr:ribosomal protein L7/L12 [Phycisphaerales bacterium]
MPLFGGPSRSDLLALSRRLANVEAKIDAIMQSLGIELSASTSDGNDDIRQLVLANEKINAIKLYRQRTGLGLKEAKDAIDAFERGEGPLAI